MNRVITARTDQDAAHAYWTMGRGDCERAFRAARRHSRVVRILRIAVPLSVSFVFVVVALVTYFNPLRLLAKLPINVDDLVVSGTKITMEQPHLSGFTRDARAYELTADAAAQDMTKPDMVELRNIRAKVEMQDKSTMEMTAISGRLRHQRRNAEARSRHQCSIRHRLPRSPERGDGRYPQGQRRVRASGRGRRCCRARSMPIGLRLSIPATLCASMMASSWT